MSFLDIVSQLGDSMLNSIWIFLLTLLFSIPLGLIICIARMYAWKPVQWIMKLYISVVRGTPLMLQLLVIYFGPYFVFGMRLTTEYRFWAVILAFSLNYAAYFAEIFRSGIQSIPVGQHEASYILGYGRIQKFIRIITPQMFKRVLPAVTNECITLVKDTSLAFAISYIELFTEASMIAAAETSMMPYLVAAIFYYVLNLIVAGVMSVIEKRMGYYKI
jgi:His/Glu/Gln/Arg/opine family amino acid ABC transporter permease subunit